MLNLTLIIKYVYLHVYMHFYVAVYEYTEQLFSVLLPSELTEQSSSSVQLDSEASSRPEIRTEEEDSRMPSSSSSSWDPLRDLSSLQAQTEEPEIRFSGRKV